MSSGNTDNDYSPVALRVGITAGDIVYPTNFPLNFPQEKKASQNPGRDIPKWGKLTRKSK